MSAFPTFRTTKQGEKVVFGTVRQEAEADLRKAQALCGIEGLATLCLEPMASVNASTKLAFDRLNAFIAIAVG